MISQQTRILWLTFILSVLVVGFLFFRIEQRKKIHRFDRFIEEAAQRYQVDPSIVKAVIWQESKFNPFARGKAGEIGLMQVREDAAFEWAEAEKMADFQHEEITDPRKNILCGTFYLSKVYKRYGKADNPLPYALADYNAGRTHVLRWSKGPAATNSRAFLQRMDFPTTREYALNVMRKRAEYQGDFPLEK
jgi:soluble lytic murein transglycosylase